MRIAAGLFVLIVILVGYFILTRPVSLSQTPVVVPQSQAVRTSAANTPDNPQTTDEVVPESDNVSSAADDAFALKQERYAKLEKARRDLDRQLARIKMVLWNKNLPKAEADVITEQLMSAYRLLRKPKLMGAFRDMDEMEQELKQVEFARNQIKQIRQQLEPAEDSS